MSTDLVIILSSDWVDSTATRARIGEEPADALQEVHDALLRTAIDSEGGRVVKNSGDGVLATFHSATAALAAAVDIQRQFASFSATPDSLAPIQVRVGLAAGDVKHLAGDILGTPVVEAVRLQSAAAPGEILCSELVRVLGYGRGGFVFEDAGALTLKGFSAPVRAQRVRRPAQSAAADPTPHEVRPSPTAARASASPDPSIAVLPFVNMSADRDQEYFSDGLSEELINQLAHIKALRVAGRTSSFALRDKAESFADIGAKLGVSYVLEGSVRRAGQRLRITAQLVKCSDGFHLWSERFDREMEDIFAIQDEIAHAVADALRVTLGIGETRTPGGTHNVEAYDLMLRAKSLVRRRALGDPERAIALLRQATVLDPKFALAWNVLGNAFTSVLTFGPDNPDAVRKEIDAALERSIALAPDLWTGHEARANQLELRHDWVAAEQANVRARALAPKSMREPIVSRAHQLGVVGRVSEAIPFAREALRIEPLAPLQTVPILLDSAGLPEEAEIEYQRSRDLTSNHFLADLLATTRRMASKDHERAKDVLALCAAADPTPRSVHRSILEVFDDPERARAFLEQNIEAASQGKRDFFRLLHSAPYACYFGANELALHAIRCIAKELLGVYILGLWHPVYAGMRKLPGFKELVAEVGLLAYWRTTGEWGEFARPLGSNDFECW